MEVQRLPFCEVLMCQEAELKLRLWKETISYISLKKEN